MLGCFASYHPFKEAHINWKQDRTLFEIMFKNHFKSITHRWVSI